jgi:hypothetical protein
MTAPIIVILGIAILLAVMYFFGGDGGGATTGGGGRRVRFSDQIGECAGDTCSRNQ